VEPFQVFRPAFWHYFAVFWAFTGFHRSSFDDLGHLGQPPVRDWEIVSTMEY
jgi:hypothetical protein